MAPIKTLDFLDLPSEVSRSRFSAHVSSLSSDGWALSNPEAASVLSKMLNTCTPLGQYFQRGIYRGLLTGRDDVFVIDEKTRDMLIRGDSRSADIIKPYIIGRDVHRYEAITPTRFLIFTRRGIDIQDYPAILDYLSKHKNLIMPKPASWRGSKWQGRKRGSYRWYEIQDPINYWEHFERPKLVYLKFQVKPAFTLDESASYPNSALWVVPSSDRFILGVLNSRVGWFLVSQFCTRIQNGYQLIYKYLQRIPVPRVNLANPTEKMRHEHMIEAVNGMLCLHGAIRSARTPNERETLQRQIAATDAQIDQLVYELYGLTPAEIKIVEAATPI